MLLLLLLFSCFLAFFVCLFVFLMIFWTTQEVNKNSVHPNKICLCAVWVGCVCHSRLGCDSKGDIHSSKVKYMVKRGKPYIWVPENDTHNVVSFLLCLGGVIYWDNCDFEGVPFVACPLFASRFWSKVKIAAQDLWHFVVLIYWTRWYVAPLVSLVKQAEFCSLECENCFSCCTNRHEISPASNFT